MGSSPRTTASLSNIVLQKRSIGVFNKVSYTLAGLVLFVGDEMDEYFSRNLPEWKFQGEQQLFILYMEMKKKHNFKY